MPARERNYVAANGLLGFFGIVSWILMGLGALGLLGAFTRGGSSQSEVIMTLGIGAVSTLLIVFGLVFLAMTQMARATIHTAEINWEMLEILRRTPSAEHVLNPSPRLRSGPQTGRGSAIGDGDNPASTGSTSGIASKKIGDVIKVYEGKDIILEKNGVSVGEYKFPDLRSAERWLDGG